MTFIPIQEAINKKKGKIAIHGWIHRIRKMKDKIFIVLRDSSEIIQCVIKDPKLVKQADSLLTESSLEIEGNIYAEKRAPTNYEIEVKKLKLIGAAEDFPIGKDQNPEFLLDNRHLSIRSRKLTSTLKIRSTIMGALHEKIRSLKFIEAEAPSFSGETSEGGSDVFEVNYFGKKHFSHNLGNFMLKV